MNKFYMVFNATTRGATKVVHLDFENAKMEARRLAIATPGHKFVVLVSAFAYAVEPHVTEERIV
jgi:hypothetical protein